MLITVVPAQRSKSLCHQSMTMKMPLISKALKQISKMTTLPLVMMKVMRAMKMNCPM